MMFNSIPDLQPYEPAYINTLLPEVLGLVFTFTGSNAAESFVSKRFYQDSRIDTLCKYFFYQLHSIVGEDYSDDFESLIDRKKNDSWLIINKKAIKYFNNLRKQAGFAPIVLPKKNEDYFSTSLISIYQEAYQEVIDKNLITFTRAINQGEVTLLVLDSNLDYYSSLTYEELSALVRKLPLRELSALIREYLKKNNVFQERSVALFSESLTLVPPEVGEFTTLKYINFVSSPLRTLPKSFSKLVNLTELKLELSENPLEKFSSALLTLSSLKTLKLCGGLGIKSLEMFGTLTTLTTLRINSKSLENLPQSFSSLKNLTELNLHATPITDFPSCLLGLSNLRTLIFEVNGNMGNIHPMNFPKSFDSLTNLTKLCLVGYSIINPPESFGSLVNLTELNFTWTKIEVLPTWIFNLTNLRKLYLENTPLHVNYCMYQLLNSLHKELPSLEHPKPYEG